MLITLTGASGSGKTSILKKLVEENVANRIITTTTREPRRGEVNGVDYHFTTKDAFDKSQMAEFVEFNDNLYGTSLDEIENAISSKEIYMVILDRKGVNNLRKLYPNKITAIYLKVSKTTCRKRLVRRDGLEKGLSRFKADKIENLYNDSGYDYVVENKKDFLTAYNQMKDIITSL